MYLKFGHDFAHAGTAEAFSHTLFFIALVVAVIVPFQSMQGAIKIRVVTARGVGVQFTHFLFGEARGGQRAALRFIPRFFFGIDFFQDFDGFGAACNFGGQTRPLRFHLLQDFRALLQQGVGLLMCPCALTGIPMQMARADELRLVNSVKARRFQLSERLFNGLFTLTCMPLSQVFGGGEAGGALLFHRQPGTRDEKLGAQACHLRFRSRRLMLFSRERHPHRFQAA